MPTGSEINVPFYGGGMSYGSVSITTMLSRIKAAAALGTFCCTGEGGYPDELKPYDDHVITQVATGLFGVSEETIRRVKIVEFKYAQGAKPGLGRTPPGRQGDPGRCPHAGGRGGVPLVFTLSLSQRVFGGRPQKTRGLDKGHESTGPGIGQGVYTY